MRSGGLLREAPLTTVDRWSASAHRSSAVVLLAVAAVVPWSTGCGSCDVDCVPGPAPTAVEATVVAEGDDVVGFLIDGSEVTVLVLGEAAALEAGTTYLVPLHREPGRRPSAILATGCDCGPVITELDGSEIDIGSGLPADLGRIATLTIGGFAAVVVLWGAGRWARGRPLF